MRRARPWDRLSYIARMLPAAVDSLVPELRLRPGARVLDYGCADMPYRHLLGGAEVVGADLEGNPDASLTLRADGTVPAEDESFDAVLSTQVLEHVGDPGVYLSECVRLPRPGGRLLLTTHGIMVYHPDPVDYWRWTCDGLQHVIEQAGLQVVRFEGVMGLAASGPQLFQDSVYYRLPGPLAKLFALCVQGAIAVADRLEPRESRKLNALVFAVVAEKP